MNSDKYSIQLESPSIEEFLNLRNKIGWGELDFNIAKTSLNNSLFHVTVREKSHTYWYGAHRWRWCNVFLYSRCNR